MKREENMKKDRASVLSLAALATFVIGASSAVAGPITITAGNNHVGIDNVLFVDGTGTKIFGSFKGSGTGYEARFISDSGDHVLIAKGGQATLEGGSGNSPLASLTFGLMDDATFTKAVLNADGEGKKDGTISFVVDYIDPAGSYSETRTLKWSGQNYFTIEATGAKITTITLSSPDIGFSSVDQIRMGGFAPGNLPDGGTTVALLGLGLVGIAGLRRKNG